MKHAKSLWLTAGLAVGLILGYFIASYCGNLSGQCCTGLCNTGLPPVNQISKSAARDAIRCYRKEPISVDSLKGFLVNLGQLHAMNKLFSENQKLSGFRLYFGVIGDPVDVTIVCGVAENKDATETSYVTFRRDSGPCPDLCDSDSDLEESKR